MTFHHIGYAVKNLPNAVKNFELLGFDTCANSFWDQDRKVHIQLMRNCNNILIELVAPGLDGSPVDTFLESQGPGSYHLCFATDNIGRDKEILSVHKFKTIIDIEQAPALGECKVVFLYNKEIGLIELAEFSGIQLV